jgi:hypothetical protein
LNHVASKKSDGPEIASNRRMTTEGTDEMQFIEPNPFTPLSRDRELLRMLAQGCSNKVIANFLNVSPPTAKKQVQAMFLKILVAKEGVPIPGLTTEQHRMEEPQPSAQAPRVHLYGLPCSKCHAYYSADMSACPICKSPDRESPNPAPALPVVSAITPPASPVAPPLAIASSQPSVFLAGEQSPPTPTPDQPPRSCSPHSEPQPAQPLEQSRESLSLDSGKNYE